MKALVKSKSERGLWLEEVALPRISINEVLIKIFKTGVCGTDLHIFNWDEWAQKTIPVPMTVGHEFVGEIVEVGSNVCDFKVGDIVSGEGHLVCGRCRHCMGGKRHLCQATKGVGVNCSGAFAEYIALPHTNLWLQTSDIPLEVASIFDPFGNAVHTALSFPLLGEDVLITGAGPIGLMAIPVARHAGARFIVVVEKNPYRRQLADRLGATLVIEPQAGGVEAAQKKLGMAEGFDIALEMSGSAAALNDAVNNMAHGGRIAMLGIPPSDITFDFNKVIFNMLTIKGIYGREMYDTWYKMQVMVQSGVDISPIITHRFQYTEFQEAFELMNSGNCGKIILNWTD